MLIWDNFSNAVKSNVCVLLDDADIHSEASKCGFNDTSSIYFLPFLTCFHSVWSSCMKLMSCMSCTKISLTCLAFRSFQSHLLSGLCHLSWRWFSCYHVIEVIRDGRIKAGGQSFVQRWSLRSDVNGHSIVHWLSVNDLWLIPTQCDWLCLFGSCGGMDVLTVLAGENILENQSPM